MTEECIKRTRLTPRKEQLGIAECMLLGFDSTCIAGTGWGQTFALPMFVRRRRVMIVRKSARPSLFMQWGQNGCTQFGFDL